MASPRSVLSVAALGAVLAFIDATIVNVAFPDIRASFPDASLSGISWVLNAYNIVFAAFLVAAGRIADLLGRKRLFEGGIWLFTAASVLCSIAPSVETLIAARCLQAVGAAILVPASLALVLEAFPEGERAHGVAMWSAAAALAAGLGPSLGGILVEIGGWRLAFLVNLPIGVLAVLASKRTLVESRAPGRRRLPDLPGALLLAAATALLTLGVVEGGDWGWTSPGVLSSFAGALFLFTAFIARSRRHRSPMLDLSMLRIRSLAVSNVITIVGAAGYYAYILCNVLFLTTVWGYSVLEAGLAISPGPAVAFVVARPAAKAADRLGAGPVIAVGAAIWAAAMAYFVNVVGPDPAFTGQWLPGMALLGIGAGITFPVVGGAAVAAVSGGRFATATGLNSVARQLGAVLGVALLVAIVGMPEPAELADAFDRGWTFAAFCFAACAIGGLGIGRIRRAEEESTPAKRETASGVWSAQGVVPDLAPASEPATPAPPRRTTAEHIAAVPMFAGLPADSIAHLAEHVRPVSLPAGEWLFKEGDAADAVYVVTSGRLEVLLERDKPELLRLLGPGDVVGELALLTASGRAASIRARRDSDLIALRQDDFDRLLDDDRRFSRDLLRIMGLQLARSRDREPVPPAPSRTVAIVPMHVGLPMTAICDALESELSRSGAAVRLGEPTREDAAGRAELLHRYERNHEHILLVAGDAPEWRDFCIGHADLVLVVAGEGKRPGWTEGRSELAGCHLLFADPAESSAALRDWLDTLQPKARHVLGSGEPLEQGVARAARRVAGRSVGVVLSGGGARTMAHIGVIEELERAGIQIDRIGGCSMGAFIGAMLAAGMEADEIDARCYEEWVRRRPLTDYRIPRESLIRGDKVRALLARNVPGQIEELGRDYFCVSGDLLSGELVIHRRGPVADAVSASLCLPGLAAPVQMDNRMLVDGGVLNNLPVDVMAATAEGPVIAVDVTTRFEVDPNDEESRPGFVETLMRALLLGSTDTAASARAHADLVITPDNRGVGMLEFHQLDRLREAGREAASAALANGGASVLG
jgi:NTE family protein